MFVQGGELQTLRRCYRTDFLDATTNTIATDRYSLDEVRPKGTQAGATRVAPDAPLGESENEYVDSDNNLFYSSYQKIGCHEKILGTFMLSFGLANPFPSPSP